MQEFSNNAGGWLAQGRTFYMPAWNIEPQGSDEECPGQHGLFDAPY